MSRTLIWNSVEFDDGSSVIFRTAAGWFTTSQSESGEPGAGAETSDGYALISAPGGELWGSDSQSRIKHGFTTAIQLSSMASSISVCLLKMSGHTEIELAWSGQLYGKQKSRAWCWTGRPKNF